MRIKLQMRAETSASLYAKCQLLLRAVFWYVTWSSDDAGTPALHSRLLLPSQTHTSVSPICRTAPSTEISGRYPNVLTKYIVVFLGVCTWISSQSLKISHNVIHRHFLLTVIHRPDAVAYRGGFGGVQLASPPRNAEVLTKSKRIANWAENV